MFEKKQSRVGKGSCQRRGDRLAPNMSASRTIEVELKNFMSNM